MTWCSRMSVITVFNHIEFRGTEKQTALVQTSNFQSVCECCGNATRQFDETDECSQKIYLPQVAILSMEIQFLPSKSKSFFFFISSRTKPLYSLRVYNFYTIYKTVTDHGCLTPLQTINLLDSCTLFPNATLCSYD